MVLACRLERQFTAPNTGLEILVTVACQSSIVCLIHRRDRGYTEYTCPFTEYPPRGVPKFCGRLYLDASAFATSDVLKLFEGVEKGISKDLHDTLVNNWGIVYLSDRRRKKADAHGPEIALNKDIRAVVETGQALAKANEVKDKSELMKRLPSLGKYLLKSRFTEENRKQIIDRFFSGKREIDEAEKHQLRLKLAKDLIATADVVKKRLSTFLKEKYSLRLKPHEILFNFGQLTFITMLKIWTCDHPENLQDPEDMLIRGLGCEEFEGIKLDKYEDIATKLQRAYRTQCTTCGEGKRCVFAIVPPPRERKESKVGVTPPSDNRDKGINPPKIKVKSLL